MSLTTLERVIQAMAGPDAAPRADQTRAVAELVEHRKRVLVVQATGWGKSAVYWAATAALREQGAGPTLVVSPLLALMRDQIAAASRAGLRAATVNSTNVDDWAEVLGDVRSGAIDVLLISPERLSNPSFARQLPELLSQCGLLVIDEAHCVSDWGFDFRPDYQRLTKTLLQLAPGTPVLATTATANERVTADVAAQLGPDTVTLRGSLARASLRLAVVPPLSPLERYAWVADALRSLPGSGIVYVLTVAETERVTAFLRQQGLDVAAYSGQTTNREQLEDRLRDNQVKALVATSALGMGYDKPDLAFCIHLGSPASPVAYYQQVGRAGRALDDALAVLVPAESDERIWEYFATAGIPDERQVEGILDALTRDPDQPEPQSLAALEAATGLRRNRLEGLLKILAVDDAVERRTGGWVATGQPWYFDEAKWAALRKVRSAEADLMRAYAHGEGCLMQFLQLALDDPDPQPVRPLLGVHRPAARAGRASDGRDDQCRPAVLPRSGRGRRTTEALGRADPGPQRQDHVPGARPGAGVCRRPRLGRRTGRAVASGRPGPAGDPGRHGRGAEALVGDLAAADGGGRDAVPALPDLDQLRRRPPRGDRPAAVGRGPHGHRPTARCRRRLSRPGHRSALSHERAAGRGVRRSGAVRRRHHPDPLDADRRGLLARRGGGHAGPAPRHPPTPVIQTPTPTCQTLCAL